jgi:hypothetical protein
MFSSFIGKGFFFVIMFPKNIETMARLVKPISFVGFEKILNFWKCKEI